jgi:2-polyprenyl-6-methoxyphenol hydroxylase-like FAD-dependent oxidoreductase
MAEVMDEECVSAPVLIVGAGPAGLVAAITLARYGVGSLLVERRSGTSTLPRATAISTRTMELLRSWGLADQVRAGGDDVDFLGWAAPTLASARGEAFSVGFPTRDEAAAVSPTAPVCAPQDHLESVLAAHLRTLQAAQVRFGTEVVGLDQDDDGVTAVLRDVASGRTGLVRSRFVVGADGAHSTVRDLLGIRMTGSDRLVDHRTVLFRAPLWDVVADRRYGLYVITHPDAEGIFVPAGSGDRWLYGQELEHQRPLVGDHTDADAEPAATRLIRIASGVPDLEPDILRTGTFSFAAQIADRYRDRRAFLAGDAAHRVTPRGGTGMNTAVHDAHDLGWKLAWVLRRWAPAGLLDSYEAERRPVGLANTTRSAHPDGTRRGADDALSQDLGARIRHAWVGPGVSTLDLTGPGYTLLTAPDGSRWRSVAAALAGRAPLLVHAVDDAVAAAVGIGPRGAALLRPDGHPAASWPTATALPAPTAALSA